MIGSIHTIHIPDRKDREENMKTLNAKLFPLLSQLQLQAERYAPKRFKDKTTIQNYTFLAVRQTDGRKGCYESHIHVMKKALALDDKPALIFEDDAEFASDLEHTEVSVLFRDALKFIESEEYDILFLGSFPNMFVANETVKVKGFQHIYKTNPATTHAYIASVPFMKRMVERFSQFDGVPIDDFYKSSLIKTFAVYPSIFMQSLSPSDIASPMASFISKCGLKNFVWRLAESYCTSFSMSLKHVLFVTACFIMLLYQLSSFDRGFSR